MQNCVIAALIFSIDNLCNLTKQLYKALQIVLAIITTNSVYDSKFVPAASLTMSASDEYTNRMTNAHKFKYANSF